MAWKRIDAIGDGLFISGASALEDIELVERLGIKSVLNCAGEGLYRSCRKDPTTTLRELLAPYTVLVLGMEDYEGHDISGELDMAIDFVEQGLLRGGVVVHCAAGVSRAATVCLGFLMLNKGLLLNAAFAKLFAARDVVRPNPGFWRQLRAREVALLQAGVVLSGEAAHSPDALTVLRRLDAHAAEDTPLPALYLTATVLPGSEQIAAQLHRATPDGLHWETIDLEDGALRLRAALSRGMTKETFCVFLQEFSGSAQCEVEALRDPGSSDTVCADETKEMVQ